MFQDTYFLFSKCDWSIRNTRNVHHPYTIRPKLHALKSETYKMSQAYGVTNRITYIAILSFFLLIWLHICSRQLYHSLYHCLIMRRICVQQILIFKQIVQTFAVFWMPIINVRGERLNIHHWYPIRNTPTLYGYYMDIIYSFLVSPKVGVLIIIKIYQL